MKNVTVDFGGASPALADVSLRLGEGARHLVCGAAGSGKSTLAQTLAGMIPKLITPSGFSGEVIFSGAAEGEDPFRAIGVVIQNVEDQLWDLSVEDLIAFPLENRGLPRPDIRARVADLIREFGLEALKGRRVLSLSGGERRMVAIAAALAGGPEFLVLDEPTTGLDPAARIRLVEMLARRRDETLVVVEQDPAAVAGLVETVSLLSSGALSPAMPLAAVFAEDRLWIDAGILPPQRKPSLPRSIEAGETVLAVNGLETALSRSNGTPVLENVSFALAEGEVVGLIGKNGAGKTTLFQSILGLAAVKAGSIAIAGEDAGRWTVARRARSVAYLPQNMRRVLFNMSVLEEVLFAVTGGGKRNGDAEEKARAALEKYGLSGHAEANPFALSSRQQALLGLACADASGARIAILDEPLLARDIAGRAMLDRFIETMLASGRAILLISHDLELVDDVTSRVLVLSDGVIACDRPTAAIWTDDAFAALGWPGPRGSVDAEVADAHS
nr:ABC transporter ATP-binding protein [Martelella sp. HB161492]